MSTKFWKFFKFIFPTSYTYYKTTNLKIFNFNLIVYRIFFRCYTYNINKDNKNLGGNTMNLGKEIRMRRVQNDMTVTELAAKLGVTMQYLSGIEHNKRNPSMKLLRKLAKELNCSVFDFIEE